MATNPPMNSLVALAAKAGKSPKAFAKANIHADGPVGKMARMYYMKLGLHGAGKSRMDAPGDGRKPNAKLQQLG